LALILEAFHLPEGVFRLEATQDLVPGDDGELPSGQ
jgi:hypothetical protein